ncbi:UDP-glycosyltransferase UGT5-like [Diprion similis]|uniref:UDP-glycosyltransferase UGT5-like n=1 Tax=Diprion similis TaxID=362088 RepID=UPI001EF91178|nr:UDP-glycosyltransferase UGT5-like [Diprion similis]
MCRYFISVVLILALSNLHEGCASRILCVFPYPSISHQIVFRRLTLALRERGHELVVVTPNPINDPKLKNFTEIDISFLYKPMDLDWMGVGKTYSWYEAQVKLLPKYLLMTESIISHPELQKLYKPDSERKFDLLLLELIRWPVFLSFAEQFGIPVIGLSSTGLATQQHYGIGNPIIPSHPSHWKSGIGALEHPTFWQRLCNFVETWRFLYWYRTTYMQKQQEIVRKYFGNDISDLRDLEKNISLVFVNQPAPISFVRPNVPNIIDIGGLQISDWIPSLPKDLQRTLDKATQGFVYMSLGTNVKSVILNNETKKEFITAFSELPYIVIWKFEDEILPGRSDNVIIMKWTPQQSILAHPNIKVFIYQGGRQSTEEAVFHGVPLIGLPVNADQEANVHKMVSLGVGKKLDIFNINRFNLVKAIQSVASDGSYKQRMLKLRDLMKDKPYDLMENAVWWTEHVIRHKGAPHLHSTTADDPWYQRQDMDMIFIITKAIFAVFGTTLLVTYKLLIHGRHVLYYQLSAKKKTKTS